MCTLQTGVVQPLYIHVKSCTDKKLLSDLLEHLDVPEDSDDALHGGKLAVQTEEKQHDEEEDGPEWSTRHVQQGLREDNECKTRTFRHLQPCVCVCVKWILVSVSAYHTSLIPRPFSCFFF